MIDFSKTWEIAWNKLPRDLRQRAVKHLREGFDPQFFEEVRKLVEEKGLHDWLPLGWHFGQGMAVRNYLREVIKDDELPSLDEYYGPKTDVRNWDDYYIQCIEAAAGLREV